MTTPTAYTRQQALQDIVDLATRHSIGAADIATALSLRDDAATHDSAQKSMIARLFSYIGGTLVFTGLCIFISMFWDDFSSLFRVLITFGTGIVIFAAAMACARTATRQSLVAPLLLVSAILQPAGMLVMFDEYGGGGDARHAIMTVSGVLLFQYVMAFISIRRDMLAGLAMLAGGIFVATLADMIDIPERMIMLALGISYLCLATAFARTLSVRHSSFWHMVGALLLLGSFYDTVRGTVVEAAFAGLCALLVYLSIVVKSRGLLVIATLALIWYIGDYAYDMFADNGLFPLGLIVAGGIFMGLGSLAMRLDRRFIRQG